MNFLFLFLDGVGLGAGDPQTNPFARADMPTLQALLGGQRLLAGSAPYDGERAALLPLDALMGVKGLPQSATGQATLLTGLNVPGELGYHYGPKPNEAVAGSLRSGSLFSRFLQAGRRTALLSAYPPRYFEAILSGRRLYSAVPLAATAAGLPLKTITDLRAGQALAADFTARGWREQLGLDGVPELSPQAAGQRLGVLSQAQDFAFFEYWLSDYAGHRQDMAEAVALLEDFDRVLGGLIETWIDEQGLVLITSDHGNLEDLSTRRHTTNPVPALVIGAPGLRKAFAADLHDLSDVAPAILNFLL
jgi:hypothetical protein